MKGTEEEEEDTPGSQHRKQKETERVTDKHLCMRGENERGRQTESRNIVQKLH